MIGVKGSLFSTLKYAYLEIQAYTKTIDLKK